MGKVLTIQELERIQDRLARFNSCVVEFYKQYDEAIKVFDSSEVVQSLYQSGNYGLGLKEELQKVKKVMDSYFEMISNGPNSLNNVTKRYISEQIDLQSTQVRGYSVSESNRQRREGNQG